MLSLSACSVVGPIVRPPKFSLLEAGVTGLNAPGVFSNPSATVSMRVRVDNPNPIGVPVRRVTATLYLDGEAAASIEPLDFELAASASRVLTIHVVVPLSGTLLWSSVLKAARGRAVAYRLEGQFSLDLGALGQPHFGPYVLAQDTLRAGTALTPAPPSFHWRADLTSLSAGADGFTLDTALEIRNSGPLGYRLEAPVQLRVGGIVLASGEAGGIVPAGGSGVVFLQFRLNPGALLAAARAKSFSFQLTGAPTLIAPGFDAFKLGFSLLGSGSSQAP